MKSLPLRLSVLCLASLLILGGATRIQPAPDHDEKHAEESDVRVQYLEIVTSSVNETCDSLAQTHGVVFSEPIAELGNARTANLTDGGRIGVRAPMRDTEAPVVRPYLLVDDIQAAVAVAKRAGAEVAIPPMEIPGQGTFSIYILGGIEHGLWQF